jgi:NADH:ubiquinone oxidoreductase subunit C
MPIESILDALREVVRTYAEAGDSHVLAVRQGLIDEVWVTLPARCIRPAIQMMVEELGIWHLSTITASDVGSDAPDPNAVESTACASTAVEVMYHFWMGRGLTLRCKLPYPDPHLPSVCDLIPGAAFYEREAAEMLGITFDDHPDPRLFLLPDDWQGGAPLRKDYDPGQHDE